MRRVVSALTLSFACAACAPVLPAKTVSMRVKGELADASVTVDDQYLGTLGYVASRGVALPPGKHRVTVEKVGYFPWDRLVEAVDAPIYLDVVLIPIPD